MIKLFAVQILAVQILLLVVLFIQDETVPGIVASVILVIAMLLILWSIVRSKEL